MRSYSLKTGYALVWEVGTPADESDTEIYTPDGTEVFNRVEVIDGYVYVVFFRPDGNKYVAQTASYCRN